MHINVTTINVSKCQARSRIKSIIKKHSKDSGSECWAVKKQDTPCIQKLHTTEMGMLTWARAMPIRTTSRMKTSVKNQ